MTTFIILLPFLFLISYFFWKKQNKKIGKKNTIIIIVTFFVLVKIYLVVSDIRYDKKYTTELQKFNVVVDALESYFNDNNKYPGELKELVPKYIDNVYFGSDILHVSNIEYSPITPNKSSKWNNKIFIGENVPPYTLTLWGSGGLSGDTVIRYCPKKYVCAYKMDVSVSLGGGNFKTEEKIFEADRLLDGNWVRLKDY